jgi:hypothetical protein
MSKFISAKVFSKKNEQDCQQIRLYVDVNPQCILDIGVAKNCFLLEKEGKEYFFTFPYFKDIADAFACLDFIFPSLDLQTKTCFSGFITPSFLAHQNTRQEPKDCHIYILKNENDLIKIGITKNKKRRICNLETGSGYKIVNKYFSAVLTRNEAKKIEQELHLIFSDYRKLGEWFKLDFEKTIVALQQACDNYVLPPREVETNPLPELT